MRLRIAAAVLVVTVAGCTDRGVAVGPETRPSTGAWVAVWVAASLAIVVLARLLVPGRGGARVAATLLSVHASAAVVGTATLAGLALRSGPLVEAKDAGRPPSGTSLLNISVLDGDPVFYEQMLLVVLGLGVALTALVALAAHFARGDDPAERWTACGVLSLELAAAGYALARVLQGRDEWPWILAAAHLPLVAVALATCAPRPRARPDGGARRAGSG